jgi:glycosyltransferase involved in cell wall biosynthesis
MRIGIMLRCIDEKGGIGVYTRNIVQELLKVDQQNEYRLFYSNEANLGRYAGYQNAKEIYLYAPHKSLWDQVAIPYMARKERIDLLFHPKFTVPLLTTTPAVMVVHGADWFIPGYDQIYTKSDVLYIKTVMPQYLKKAAGIISVSNYSTEGFLKAFPWSKEKFRTVYFGPNRIFKRVTDAAVLDKIRLKYNLPDKFILTVTRYDPGTKNTRKNFGGMIEAYKRCRNQVGFKHKFVVAGKDCYRFSEEYNIRNGGLEKDVVFPGYIDQSDLPALYTLADLYLYPSFIEAFPIPICEALACGCPIVTSRDTGCGEIAGDAALLVDPADPAEIAGAICKVLEDEKLRQRLSAKGIERSRMFSWDKCAKETFAFFESVMAGAV